MSYRYCSDCRVSVVLPHDCPKKQKRIIDYKKRREKLSEEAIKQNKFYSSRAWQIKRSFILRKNHYRCYVSERLGEIVQANDIHHIQYISTKEGWGKRLDDDNLIPLSSTMHRLLHFHNINSKEKLEKFILELKYQKENR